MSDPSFTPDELDMIQTGLAEIVAMSARKEDQDHPVVLKAIADYSALRVRVKTMYDAALELP